MSVRGRTRRLLLLALAAALAATLGVQAPGTAASAGVDSYVPPTGAGGVYRWGFAHWQDEFLTRLSSQWRTNRPDLVETRIGMLTLKGRRDGGPVTATLKGQAFRYGRWEARVRIRNWEDTRVPYRVVTELVPAGDRAYHCGARNILLGDYVNGRRLAHLSIRTLPDNEFTYSARPNTGVQQWSTFGIEITRKRISWFVNDQVVMTERRSAALSGTPYTLRFRIVGDGPTELRPPWMQMDWARYHTLERKNALPVKAPQAQAGTYARAC